MCFWKLLLTARVLVVRRAGNCDLEKEISHTSVISEACVSLRLKSCAARRTFTISQTVVGWNWNSFLRLDSWPWPAIKLWVFMSFEGWRREFEKFSNKKRIKAKMSKNLANINHSRKFSLLLEELNEKKQRQWRSEESWSGNFKAADENGDQPRLENISAKKFISKVDTATKT